VQGPKVRNARLLEVSELRSFYIVGETSPAVLKSGVVGYHIKSTFVIIFRVGFFVDGTYVVDNLDPVR